MAKSMRQMRALGFLAMFAPIALLVAGRIVGFDWILVIAYFVAFPALRPLFGSTAAGEGDQWTTTELSFLSWIPRAYVAALALTLAWILREVANRDTPSAAGVGFVISTLVMCGLATCVAHDLAHRRRAWDRRAGHLVAALIGYPFLAFEHLEHHRRPDHTASGNCPRIDESVWSYVARRFVCVPLQVCGRALDKTTPASKRNWLDQVWLYVAISAAAWLAFTTIGGWYGALLYGMLVVGVPFLLNTITYIQHWGLGDDNPIGREFAGQTAWDEDCRFQSWLIVGVAFHRQHHAAPGMLYCSYGPSVDAPKLPAEYAIMVLVCFVPALWRRIMVPTLNAWHAKQREVTIRKPLHAPSGVN